MPDIWQRSFLQADGDSLDDDSDGADAPTLDAGEMEKQALDALDLSTRDEGGLVVKHNPWCGRLRASSLPLAPVR